MKEAATIVFKEADTGEEAVAIVRYDDTRIALALSKKLDGDVEVVMSKEDAEKILSALRAALV